MQVDRRYCASSYLMYRTMADPNRCFTEGWEPKLYWPPEQRFQVHDARELERGLREQVERICALPGETALALSGGIDSAILARLMPKGTRAYTFRCVVPGMEVVNEAPQAARYARECGLDHQVIDIYWEDFLRFAPVLMRHKHAPIHSIEVQIYKAALRAKADGFSRIIYGESADLNYGGLSGLLSRDWTVGEFIDRYSYVKPYHALREFEIIPEPIARYERNGYVEVHEFCRDFFLREAIGSYINACTCGGIEIEMPYLHTWMAVPMDYNRVRGGGQNKYIVRELFSRLYPGWEAAKKLPMPRATNEWLKDWEGPRRPEFWPHCTDPMTGDQRWMVLALEMFFDLLDEKEARQPRT